MEGLSVLNHQTYQRVLWERRIMFTATSLCVFSVALFVIAMATASWASFDIWDAKANATICLYLGVWGKWSVKIDPTTKVKESTWFRHFPEASKDDPLSGVGLLHYYRTQAVFGVVGLILMLLGNGFALYSFNHHRYMYKRLTAGLLAFVAMCVLVVVEVLIHSVQEWRTIDKKSPAKSSQSVTSYGYSTYLSWIVFAVYLGSALVFLVGGRKQKGNRAATAEFEEEDRPVNLA